MDMKKRHEYQKIILGLDQDYIYIYILIEYTHRQGIT